MQPSLTIITQMIFGDAPLKTPEATVDNSAIVGYLWNSFNYMSPAL